jgi:hypothetical protein
MKTFFILLSLFVSSLVNAQTIGLHLVSWHDKPGYNNTNPGLYLKTEKGYLIGTVKNSEGNQSYYMGRVFDYPINPRVSGSLTVGVISGYKVSPLLPLVTPSLAIRVNPSDSIRVSYLPKINKSGSHALHMSFERKF